MRLRSLLTALGVVAVTASVSSCSEQIESADPNATIATTTPAGSTLPGSTATPSTTTPPTSGPVDSSTSSTSSTSTTSTNTTTTSTTLPPPPQTSCEQVVHIGDSTAVPLFDPAGVGGAELTLQERYEEIGVEVVYPDNDGARSIVERIDDRPNALDVAEGVRANGFDGCWVIMVGTNDAANIAAGANTSAEDRIRRMMDTIGGDPVLWVNAVTQRTEDAYRNASMLAWNDELERVTAEYPNVRLFDWYDVVQPQWFRNDGIHYTVEGSAQRAARTAQALVAAFPATQ
jgi:hypothetical protein